MNFLKHERRHNMEKRDGERYVVKKAITNFDSPLGIQSIYRPINNSILGN